MIKIFNSEGEPLGLFGTEIQESHATNIINDMIEYINKCDYDDFIGKIFTEMKEHGYNRVFAEELTVD